MAIFETLFARAIRRGELTDVEVLRSHYGHLLEAWYDPAAAARAGIIALYDERFFRLCIFYLAGARCSFADGPLVDSRPSSAGTAPCCRSRATKS